MKDRNRFVLIILTILVISVFTVAVSANDGYQGECGTAAAYSFDPETGELRITGSGPMKNYKDNNQPWRSYRKQIKTVTVGEGITSIGENAFYRCEELTEITLPKSLKSIGMWAFNQCRALRSVSLPEGLSEIGVGAFNVCESLTEIHVPESVTKLGYSAFSGSGIKSLTIPEGIKEIDGICAGCAELESVTLPQSLTKIGDSSFSGCVKLKEIKIPEGVTKLGYAAFSACFALTGIEIPKGVTEIGEGAFGSCGALTSVTLPKSLKTLGASAFSNCTGLSEIVFHGKCQTVGANAFSGCDALRSVHISDLSSWLSISFANLYATPLSVRGSTLLLNEEPLTHVTVPEGVTEIKNYSFAWCKTLTSVSLPDSVTKLGEGAFYGCHSLSEINIPKGVTEIRYLTFVDCPFTELILPQGLLRIGESSITGNDLEELVIPEGVTHIESMAFVGCNRLKKLILPSSLVSIGDDLLRLCDDIEEVYFLGSEEQWSKISIGSGNDLLTEKRILHESHTYDKEIAEERFLKEAADCDSVAVYYKSCVCGQIGEETFMGDQLGHVPAREATCLSPALCAACGEEYGPLGDHDLETAITAPTCTEGGEAVTFCAVCQYSEGVREIPPTGHFEGDWILDRKANLFRKGKLHTECLICGEIIRTMEQKRVTAGQLFGCNSAVGGYGCAIVATILTVLCMSFRKKRID